MIVFRRLLIFWTLLCALPLQAQDNSTSAEDVPYGVASSWLYGHHMLVDGNIEEALRNLHYAYRTHPDVALLAWDFQEALVAGQYFGDALEVLDKLINDYPDEPQYRLQRSQVYLNVGENKKALADLRELRSQDQVNLDVIVGEATILAAMGKSDEALDACREGLILLPDDGPRIFLTMSVILDQDGRQEELPELLEEAVAAYPDSPQLHDIRMRSLMTIGRPDEALEAARQSDLYFAERLQFSGPDSSENPESMFPPRAAPPLFVVELADLYSKMGNPEKAIEILEPMFKAGSLPLEPCLWLSRLYLGTGQIDLGMQHVDEILLRWPTNGEAWFLRGRGLESEGHVAEALVAYAQGVQYAPNDPQVRLGYLRGMLVGWEQDLQAPIKNAEQLGKVEKLQEQAAFAESIIAPADSEGQLVLGYAFRSTDQNEKAIAAFKNAAKEPGLVIPATLQLSVCYDLLDQLDQARLVLEDLYHQFPENPEVANSLGYYLAEKGLDLEKAHNLIIQALNSGPGNGAYLDSMGWVLYQLGKPDEAFDYMIQAVNVLPDDPIILEHLALVLVKLGQHGEAEEMLRRALLLGGEKERLEDHLDSILKAGEGQ